MRILLISHTCQSRAEGHPRAAALSRMPDIDLLVITPSRWRHYGNWRLAERPVNDEFQLSAEKIALPWAGPAQFYLHFYPKLRKIVDSFQPDVIDIWEEPWALVSLQALRVRDRTAKHAKILIETEQNILRTLPQPFEKIRQMVLQNVDYVIGRSVDAVEVVREKGYTGVAGVVGNAVNETVFQPMDKRECRRALGIDPSAFVVGYVGRLIEDKGVLDIVESLSGCPDNTHCVFVGTGPMEEELSRRAAALNLTSRVHLIGSKPSSDLPQIMNGFDALALMSRTTRTWKEQFGRVIIEANACNVPVIGSRSGAIPSVTGAAGIIVPERDVKALTAAISKLQADPALAARLGRIGRIQVEMSYTWKRQAELYAQAYRIMTGASVEDAMPTTVGV